MIFNALWTILLGVIGGIISSLIVSRVFLIQSEYQDQVRFVDRIIRKVGYISSFLYSAEAILKVSYDHNIQMEKEIKEKGYDSEKEYYAAHTDEDWISKKDVLDVFHKEIAKTTKLIHEDLSDNFVKDTQLNVLIRDVVSYVHDVSSIKEYTFSQISQLTKKEQDLLKQYDMCIHMSGKKLVGLVIKDKIMILLFVIVGILIVGTIFAFSLGVIGSRNLEPADQDSSVG